MPDVPNNNLYISYTTDNNYAKIKNDILNNKTTEDVKSQYSRTLFITNKGGIPSNPASSVDLYLGSQLISDIIILNRFKNISIIENNTTKCLKVTNNGITDTTIGDGIGNINKLYIWYNISNTSDTATFNFYYFDDSQEEYKYIPVTKHGGTTTAGGINFVTQETDIANETSYQPQTWVYFDQPNPDAPPYDTNITYIEANGTQFIDTDIYFNAQYQSLEVTVEWPNGVSAQPYINIDDEVAVYNANKLLYYDFIGAFKQGSNSIYDRSTSPAQLIYAMPQSSSFSYFRMYDLNSTDIDSYYGFKDNQKTIWNNAINGEKQKFFLTDKAGEDYGVEVISTGETYNTTSWITVNWEPLSPLRIFGFKGYTGNFNINYQGTSTLYANVPDTIYTYATIRLYDMKVTDLTTNTIIHHLVPAKRTADNVIGLYDEITDTFYTNNGTGIFGYGTT